MKLKDCSGFVSAHADHNDVVYNIIFEAFQSGYNIICLPQFSNGEMGNSRNIIREEMIKHETCN